MSHTDSAADPEIREDLSEEDRVWLQEQLIHYRELLQYLHDH